MAGHSPTPKVVTGDARVQVAAGNVGETLMDARVGKPDEAALEKLKRRAGGAYEELLQQAKAFEHELQRELDQLAGGVAPPSVQALRQIVVSQLMAHKAAQLVAFGHLRKITEADIDDDVQHFVERWEKGQRLLAALAVVVKDLLVELRKVAKDAALTLPGAANDNGSLLSSLNIVATPLEGES